MSRRRPETSQHTPPADTQQSRLHPLRASSTPAVSWRSPLLPRSVALHAPPVPVLDDSRMTDVVKTTVSTQEAKVQEKPGAVVPTPNARFAIGASSKSTGQFAGLLADPHTDPLVSMDIAAANAVEAEGVGAGNLNGNRKRPRTETPPADGNPRPALKPAQLPDKSDGKDKPLVPAAPAKPAVVAPEVKAGGGAELKVQADVPFPDADGDVRPAAAPAAIPPGGGDAADGKQCWGALADHQQTDRPPFPGLPEAAEVGSPPIDWFARTFPPMQLDVDAVYDTKTAALERMEAAYKITSARVAVSHPLRSEDMLAHLYNTKNCAKHPRQLCTELCFCTGLMCASCTCTCDAWLKLFNHVPISALAALIGVIS